MITTAPVRFGVSLGTEESSLNLAGTVVKRDSAGDFSAGRMTGDVTGAVTGNVTGNLTGNVTGNVTGAVTGNASTATAWQTARNLSLTGDVTATLASVDGTAAVSAAATVANGAVTAAKLGTDVFKCVAWVCFNGTVKADNSGAAANGDDVLLKASANVASVKRVSASAYTINFSQALADANYAFSGTVNYNSLSESAWVIAQYGAALATSKQSGLLTISIMQAVTTPNTAPPQDCCVMIFR
jgi:hypothetical protein